MNVKQVLGTITVIIIIGGTIYAIKKSKDADKLEEESISVEEALEIARRNKEKMVKTPEPPKVAPRFDKEEELEEEEELDDEEDKILTINDVREELGFKPIIEEDNELRHDPNSIDARNQFIKMELAEWEPLADTYTTMRKLFEFPFEPRNDGDEVLRTQIIDYRMRFFGYGQWAKEVTFADVIMHYARAAQYNVNETIRYWVDYFLDFNDIDVFTSSREIDEILKALNSHTYFNEERQTFGLFGLTRESMDQAIRIANRNIDRSVTYEIEFNEFLKSCL